MSFTAKDVQALREKTGCGMMDCKKALTESQGNVEKAIEILREKGLAAASKKAGRIAAEGVVYGLVNDDASVGTIIEVNSETDFVAKNGEFIKFVDKCAKTVIDENPSDVNELLEIMPSGDRVTVAELLREKILTIGENIKIRRFMRYEGNVCTYIHGGGRIGVMVNFEVSKELAKKTEFNEMAKNVAMQIAAANPSFVDKNSVPNETIEKEKEILTAQAINEGKPAEIAEKMVMGRIGKFYKDVCLLEQAYIKNSDINVAKYIDEVSKELGGAISVRSFVRFEKGEGLEKREDNFADEVASMIK